PRVGFHPDIAWNWTKFQSNITFFKFTDNLRKSPTLINIPLLTALTLGAALAHNEPSTSPMERVTLMIFHFNNRGGIDFKHNNYISNHLDGNLVIISKIFPVGLLGDWSYTIYNSGISGDFMRLTSIGGLGAINFLLASWTQIISDFFILNHRINRATRTVIVDEDTALISEIEQPQPSNNLKVYKDDLTVNFYLRILIFVAVLFLLYRCRRLKHIESNVNRIPYERVGCILPTHNTSVQEMLKKTATISTGLQAKIVWGESALALRNDDELDDLLENAYRITTAHKFYLGLTYTIPTGDNESYSIESGPGKLKVVNAEIETKSKKELHKLDVSGAICLDMDFPELLGQAAAADFVGIQHLQMSSVRAIENGYWILRCDGGGASGLIDPYGRVRHFEISSNEQVNIFAWEMPFTGEKIETYYSKYVEFTVWGALIFLGLAELLWYFSWKVAEEDMTSLSDASKEFLRKRQEWAEEKYDEIFDQEELNLRAKQSLI
ncbi:14584_t:CDS:2, partial [Funneliformis caledonium]